MYKKERNEASVSGLIARAWEWIINKRDPRVSCRKQSLEPICSLLNGFEHSCAFKRNRMPLSNSLFRCYINMNVNGNFANWAPNFHSVGLRRDSPFLACNILHVG